MAELVVGNGVDQIQSPDGTGFQCASPTIQYTDECSLKVSIGGHGIVCAGDKMSSHNGPGCSAHQPGLTSYSSKVSIGGKGVARKGDTYGGDHTIITGSVKVSAT